MPRPQPLPESVPHPAFGTREALVRGVTKARLRSSDLVSPFHGIRSTHEANTLEERCRQYLPRLRPGQFFSHSTAAALLDVPLPRSRETDDRLHISDRSSRPRTDGAVGHRAHETPVILLRDLPITDPAWLLPELTGMLTLDELIVAADGLVRRKRAPSTLEQLRAMAGRPDVRGIRTVRAALREARSGTDSPMETRLRLLLTRAGLPEPVIGHAIRDTNGDFVGTPDLCYVEQRIAIEYEGAVHRDDPRVFAEDILRRELMQEADWYVIRVIAEHVFRTPDWLVSRIKRILTQRTPLRAAERSKSAV
jgi:hypothetical protein